MALDNMCVYWLEGWRGKLLLNFNEKKITIAAVFHFKQKVKLMYTDAMILYKEIYGAWPKSDIPGDEAERINLVELLTELYLTKHQQEHAGQKAPGSEGIKQVLYTNHDELTNKTTLYKKNETSTKAILFFEHSPLQHPETQICHSPDVTAPKGL